MNVWDLKIVSTALQFSMLTTGHNNVGMITGIGHSWFLNENHNGANTEDRFALQVEYGSNLRSMEMESNSTYLASILSG